MWAHLPGTANLVVQGLVPLVLSWMVRHLRMEGRPPLRMLAGALTYASTARGGVLHGRPYREGGPRRVSERVFVAAGPGLACPPAWSPGGGAEAPASRRRRRQRAGD